MVKITFLNKNHTLLEFSKCLSYSSKIKQIDYENMSAVLCASTNDKIDKVATSHNCKFYGRWCFLYLCENNLQKTLTKAIMFIK